MSEESKQLAEQLVGDTAERLKRIKSAATQVANALITLREAEGNMLATIKEYMDATEKSRARAVEELGLTRAEQVAINLIKTSNRVHSTIDDEPAEAMVNDDDEPAEAMVNDDSDNSYDDADAALDVDDTADDDVLSDDVDGSVSADSGVSDGVGWGDYRG